MEMILEFVSDKAENIAGKGENAGEQMFPPYRTRFAKLVQRYTEKQLVDAVTVQMKYGWKERCTPTSVNTYLF